MYQISKETLSILFLLGWQIAKIEDYEEEGIKIYLINRYRFHPNEVYEKFVMERGEYSELKDYILKKIQDTDYPVRFY